MRYPLTETELNLLAQRPHKTKLYLLVDKPEPIYTARVNSGSIGYGATTIPFDNASGTLSDVKKGMTLAVGSTPGGKDKGTVRIKAASASAFTVAANSDIAWADDDDLSVLPEFRLWSVFPQVSSTGVFYKDTAEAFVNTIHGQTRQIPPVAVMGPDAVAFLDGKGVEVKFVGEYSYTRAVGYSASSGVTPSGDMYLLPTCQWDFQGGTPSSAVSFGTAASPIVVSYDTVGRYLASLTVQNSAPAGSGKTHTGYRVVHIVPRAGAGAPYTHFRIPRIEGDYYSGGWTATIQVFGDADVSEFPDNAKIILFAEDWYGNTRQSIGGYPYRENVVLVAWIMEETVVQRFAPDGEKYVEFKVQTIDGLMKSLEGYTITVEDGRGTDGAEVMGWHKLYRLQLDRAAYYLIKWHSTLFDLTDVWLIADNSAMPAQDFSAASLYRQLDDYTASSILARVLSDKQSCLFIDREIQVRPGEARTATPTVATVDNPTWLRQELVMPRKHLGAARFVEVEGTIWSGRYSTPVIAHAPGSTPLQHGTNIVKRGLVFDRESGQAEANEIAGYVLAEANQGWKNVPFLLQGNHRYLDIAPQGWLQVSLNAQDTKRGIVWVDKKFVPRTVSMAYDPEAALLRVNSHMDAEATGESGVTGDYTVPSGIPANPVIVPSNFPGWNGVAYLGTTDGLFQLRPTSIYWERSIPKGSPFSATQDLTVNGIDFDLSGLADGLLRPVIATDQGVFRAEIDTGTIGVTWSKWAVSDPPNSWSDTEPLTADGLNYQFIKADITDPGGLTFYIAASGIVDPNRLRAWIGKTTDGGSTWSWWPVSEAAGSAAWEVLSFDIDKEDGTRLLITGHPATDGLFNGAIVFSNTGTVIRTHQGDGTGGFYASPFYGMFPYLPAGSSLDGDTYLFYGSSLAATGDLGGILYWDGTQFQQVNPSYHYGVTETRFVDICPGDEQDFLFLTYFFSGEEGAPPVCRLVGSADEDWYGITDFEVSRILPFEVGYQLASRHRREPDYLMAVDRSGSGAPVRLSVNKGRTWYAMSLGLPGNIEATCCLFDWGSVL